jgi:hypothetical protein
MPKRFNRIHAAAIIFILNAIVCARLFVTEYTAYFGSVEGSFIALTRAMANLSWTAGWWPLWNNGMPFENTYFPFLPALSGATSALTGWSPALAFHFVSAIAFSLGPVALFLFAHTISKDLPRSFFAGLIYSLFSPACLLVSQLAADSGGINAHRRLFCLVFWGETPHTVGLSIIPVTLALVFLYAQRRTPLTGIAAALAMGATVLTNSFATVTLFFGVVCMLMSEVIPWSAKTVVRLAVLAIAAYALISPWLPPSLLYLIATNPMKEGYTATTGRELGIGLLVAGTIALAIFARAKGFAPQTRFAILLGWLTITPTLMFYWAGWNPLPQSARYQLELDMMIALLIAGAIPASVLAKRTVWIAIAVACFGQAVLMRDYADKLIQPANPAAQIEYRIAKAFEHLVPNQKVMTGGSALFWLNVFTDQPQVDGGHTPTAPNLEQMIAAFTIYEGTKFGAKEGEIAILWLKAFGARALAVSEETGKQTLKAVHKPHQFQGLLPELWREGGDVIYGVPSKDLSIARVIPAQSLVKKPPTDGLDTKELVGFVAALEDPTMPPANLKWESWGKATITANMAKGQVIAIQMNHDKGWTVTNGRIVKDGLGLLAIEPESSGPVTVTLEYTGSTERTLVRAASIVSMLAAGVWIGFRRRSRAANY